MSNLELEIMGAETKEAKRQEGAEQLAKYANELRSLHRAEQNAAFEIGRILCEVQSTTWLRVNLPMREERHDIALWAKREVGLTYSRTLGLIDAWRVREALLPGVNEPTGEAQLRPLVPLLKHGREGKDLINRIWERASAESNRPQGPSRSQVAKIARDEAPDIIGKKTKPRSCSKRDALNAIAKLETRYDKAALLNALRQYLKENE